MFGASDVNPLINRFGMSNKGQRKDKKGKNEN